MTSSEINRGITDAKTNTEERNFDIALRPENLEEYVGQAKPVANLKVFIEDYRAGKLKPYVMATFPLARYMEALALVRDRKVIGKAVLTTGD